MEDAAETEFLVECKELDDPNASLRQGDILEWLGEHEDPWRRFAIVVTADCDLAHQKHAGVLACVPVLARKDYLALFPLPARLAKARAKLMERAGALIREYQEANRPDFPIALSNEAVARWIDAVEGAEIVAELRVSDGKKATQLADLVTAIKLCSRAASAGGFDLQLDALTTAWVATQGKSTFEERRPALARELFDQLGRLPGDAVFLHGLSPRHRSGYVAYLRAIVNVDERTVARRVPDLRDGAVAAKRIARLTSPYVFHLSQMLGQVFSAIGLPERYESSRDAFIVSQVAHYGETS